MWTRFVRDWTADVLLQRLGQATNWPDLPELTSFRCIRPDRHTIRIPTKISCFVEASSIVLQHGNASVKCPLSGWSLALLGILSLSEMTAWGGDNRTSISETRTNAQRTLSDEELLARRIDSYLEAAWKTAGVVSAAPADDGTFLRRVYLDMIGRIPTVAEARNFLEDSRPLKRAILIERLQGTAAHARRMAVFWRQMWIPQADTPRFSGLSEDFETWLAAQLREGQPYDRLIHQLLTADMAASATQERPDYADSKSPPTTLLAVSELKPENLAANTMRAFLGINLDCAQCHDHPFSRWTREQFWQTAAFFATASDVNATNDSDAAIPVGLQLTIPETETVVTAKLLDGGVVQWPSQLNDNSGRLLLANWMTSRENDNLARNGVNRLWACFFGLGLVEPLDDLSPENPSLHPELLDELAQSFADHDFDLNYLTRALLLSRAYQLSSRIPQGGSPSDSPELFSRMLVRGLTGEQLYDSMQVAAGLPVERDDLNPAGAGPERHDFTRQFRLERPSLAERSTLQSLTLMNGPLSSRLTNLTATPALAAVANAPFFNTRERIEALYLATLSRQPAESELKRLMEFVQQRRTDDGTHEALADMFWALLNSSEFCTNH